MSRLRTITERDRLAPLAEKIAQGEAPAIPRGLALQTLDLAQAGRAALLDALDQQEKADARVVAEIGKLLDRQP